MALAALKLNRLLYPLLPILLKGQREERLKIRCIFVIIARGSLSELDAQFEISLRLKFLDKNNYEMLSVKLEEVGKMLSGLIKSKSSQ